VQVRPQSRERAYFKNLLASGRLAMERGLAWLAVDADNLSVEVLAQPGREDGEQRLDLQAIIEFYNR
jgi:3-deoxy-D-arabino-heptulosonate 7-phosphate (DAHP) synthase